MTSSQDLQGFRHAQGRDVWGMRYGRELHTSWNGQAMTLVDDVCGSNREDFDTALLPYGTQREIVLSISTKRFMPGGRYLYYAGRPVHFWNNCGSGDERFVTDKGLRTFIDCVGKSVNILSPTTGTFIEAEVQSFGQQVVNNITLKEKGVHSKKRWVKRFTSNHRWILSDSTITDKLKVGDTLKATASKLASNADGFRHGLVYADGALHRQRAKTKDYAHNLRLCGAKSQYTSAFDGVATVTHPQFAKGDPVVYYINDRNLKELPTNDSPEYIASFIKAWVALDGHSGDYHAIFSINKEAIDFFAENAHLAGYIVTSDVRVHTGPSNYGTRSPLYRIYFKLVEHFKGWEVESITEGELEQVYCVVEPQHSLFTLEGGVATGNCFLLRAEHDTREEWAAVTGRAMSCLMSGGGIGVDYSRIREEGAVLRRTGGLASGPISLMEIINEAGRFIMQGGSRRSAIWGGLDAEHPDAAKMIHKKDWPEEVKLLKAKDFNFPAALDMTNISLMWGDKFIEQRKAGTLPQLWYDSVHNMMETGEPGHSYNFGVKANSTLRNACTELDSEDDSDVCNIGSVNMAECNTLEEFTNTVRLATFFLVCGTLRADLPYDKVYAVRQKNRRIGLGLMGIHEWLLKRGYKYGTHDWTNEDTARFATEDWWNTDYPYDAIPPELHDWLKVYRDESDAAAYELCDQLGISRPVAVRAIAPTGTIGIVAGTSTGIEPIYAAAYRRGYLEDGRHWKYQYVIDPTAEYLINNLGVVPEAIETAYTLALQPERRIALQAAVQRYVDHGISSTLNLPSWGSEANNEDTWRGFADLLARYAPYLRGFTCYPDGARGGQPLTEVDYYYAKQHVGLIYDANEATCTGGICGA